MEFMSELDKENLSFFIVVTKIDKANQKSISKNIKLLKQEIVKYIGHEPNIFLSSAVKKLGREQIL
jgi:GTP-binding protein